MSTNSSKKANQEDWHPADVKAALHKRGITLSSLAKAHGLSESTSFSAALVRSMPANEKRIADALCLHPKDIWPSRYNEDGTRKPQGFRAIQCTPVALNGNGKAVAASGKKQVAS